MLSDSVFFCAWLTDVVFRGNLAGKKLTFDISVIRCRANCSDDVGNICFSWMTYIEILYR